MESVVSRFRSSSLCMNSAEFQQYLSNAIVCSLRVDGCRVGLLEFKVLTKCGISVNGISNIESECATRLRNAYDKVVMCVRANREWCPRLIEELAAIVGGGETYRQLDEATQFLHGGHVKFHDAAYAEAKHGAIDGRGPLNEVERMSLLTTLCARANERFRKIDADDIEGQYRMSAVVHACIMNHLLWGDATGRMARLMMHWVQLNFNLPLARFDKEWHQDYLKAVGHCSRTHSADAIYEILIREVRTQCADDVAYVQSMSTQGRKRVDCSDLGRRLVSGEQMMKEFKSNPKVTARQLAGKMNVSLHVVENTIMMLKQEGKLERIAPNKGGHWRVIES